MNREYPSEAPVRPPLRVGFVLLHQFTFAGFAGMVDAFRLAADTGGRSRQIAASWAIMTEGGRNCRSSCGASIADAEPLQNPENFDYIVVCGGNGFEDDNTYTPDMLAYLKRAMRAKVRLVGVCTGSFALAHAGLVGSRTVCINWNVAEAFKKAFPKITSRTDRLFIDEGDLLTCAGSTAAIDLALHLISRHCGSDKARQAVRHMILQGARPAVVPQPHFLADIKEDTHVHVQQAVHFMTQHIDAPASIEATARYVGTSARQLERLFQRELGISPKAIQMQLRLRYGQWLLANTRNPIMQIAFDCGFADAAHFTREYRAFYKCRPSDARAVSKNNAALRGPCRNPSSCSFATPG